ncbi:MAG: IS4 family transposase [Desulfamplus sp.]|nr:IS4 family transposase [Desulfamplus sp.]
MSSKEFKEDHRSGKKFFKRDRVLTFYRLTLLILQKSVKSTQLILNEFTSLFDIKPVTNSAFTQAGCHLLHTAFIELNKKAIVDVLYGEEGYKKYKDKYRLVSIDGSKVILPYEKDIIREFGAISYTNGKDSEILGSKPQATASVMYDVLNNIAIDSISGYSKAYEVDLAEEHLSYAAGSNDLVLLDRNYTSYRFLSYMKMRGIDFVSRCSRKSFKAAQEMFEGKGKDSQIETLFPSNSKEAKELGLPAELKVRFVRLKLDTGETEILVTSLMDEDLYITQDFKELYNLRWSIETFYATLKTRLTLENFTGKSAESVKQDFYAAIYITGLESILTSGVNKELEEKICNPDIKKRAKNRQKVNKAVSFNAIKNNVFDLLYSETDINTLVDKLEALFRMNPNCVRKKPKQKRKKVSLTKIINYHKRVKKVCY